ncbi:MAG: D-amino acid dehydrogenase 3 small subunit [Tardiphaga sp.]|uniref:D-amino acid dehydrogenase n=1 Tax=Tardiphaga sp. TaxID=1926292 RepID=UPI00260530B3|nr:D-amino acid dehydrogenase [Tardiphaga sp.]MDB5504372.1 D-amino acid dehydrogenase 3 small subunit [Tardiphaga sp.]
MSHIAVIGAGITGVTTAYALIEKGHTVTVFDRHRYAAMETSYANGGQLSASNAEVWNHWSTVIKGLGWLFRRDAPLSLNLAPSWHKYSWLAEFVGNIPNYRANTIATTRLAIEARQHLLAMAEKAGIDFNVEQRGILHIYHSEKDFETAAKANALLQEGGLTRTAVAADQIRGIEPALQGSYFGGFFTPSDFTGDIHKFTRGLMAYCERMGVKFVGDADVSNMAASGDGVDIGWSRAGETQLHKTHVDGVVICAGVASRRLAAMLGDRVNIYPVKGYSITVELDDEDTRAAAPWVSLLDDKAKIVTSRLGANRFRVAGTAEFNGANRDIRADRVQPLIDWTRKLFPGINTSRVIPWSGLRPMMPDMMPRVGPGRKPRVFYNTGHGHLGWTLSAATAQIVADQVSVAVPV